MLNIAVTSDQPEQWTQNDYSGMKDTRERFSVHEQLGYANYERIVPWGGDQLGTWNPWISKDIHSPPTAVSPMNRPSQNGLVQAKELNTLHIIMSQSRHISRHSLEGFSHNCLSSINRLQRLVMFIGLIRVKIVTWWFIEIRSCSGCMAIHIRWIMAIHIRWIILLFSETLLCKPRGLSQWGSLVSPQCSIHHDCVVTLYTQGANVRWSKSGHNAGKFLVVPGTRYGTFWPWCGQFGSRVITTSSALVRCWNFLGGPSVGFTRYISLPHIDTSRLVWTSGLMKEFTYGFKSA